MVRETHAVRMPLTAEMGIWCCLWGAAMARDTRAGREQFVEEMGIFFEKMGFPRMAGRIWAQPSITRCGRRWLKWGRRHRSVAWAPA